MPNPTDPALVKALAEHGLDDLPDEAMFFDDGWYAAFASLGAGTPEAQAALRTDWAKWFLSRHAPLQADFERQVAPLWAEYERQEAPLWAEYTRQVAPFLRDSVIRAVATTGRDE